MASPRGQRQQNGQRAGSWLVYSSRDPLFFGFGHGQRVIAQAASTMLVTEDRCLRRRPTGEHLQQAAFHRLCAPYSRRHGRSAAHDAEGHLRSSVDLERPRFPARRRASLRDAGGFPHHATRSLPPIDKSHVVATSSRALSTAARSRSPAPRACGSGRGGWPVGEPALVTGISPGAGPCCDRGRGLAHRDSRDGRGNGCTGCTGFDRPARRIPATRDRRG